MGLSVVRLYCSGSGSPVRGADVSGADVHALRKMADFA
jgi:hypothetical protein